MTKVPALTSLVTALAPAIWGSTYLVTTELLPPDRPLLASVLRALPAGLVLIWFTRSRPYGCWWARTMILGILNIGAFFYLLFVAAYHLPGGVAALVLSVQPVIVLVLGFLVLHQRVQALHAIACFIVIFGVGLLVLTSAAQLDIVGVLAGLGAAACMATGVVLTKKWGRPPTMGNLAFTGWQLASGGIFLAPFLIAGEGLPESLTMENFIGFSYLGIFGAALSYAVWFRGIERLPVIAVSFLSFASPLAATVLGMAFRGETLSILQLGGAVAIIGSAILVQPRKTRGLTAPADLATSESR